MLLRDWLNAEPFTLTLGSGFFGFFAHAGVLSALVEHGHEPARLTGASSGALVAGCYASGLSLAQLQNLLFTLEREDFWDPGWGFGLLKGEKFRAQMRSTLPAQSFVEARLPLRLSVYNYRSRQTEIWAGLNSNDAGSDPTELSDAIYASCALPLLFQPLHKNGLRYGDGGIKDRPALAGVAVNERVLIHHLASKSPWRRANDPALIPPQRGNGVTLVVDDLQRTSPFKLHTGRRAFAQAYRATTAALGWPVAAIMAINPALTPAR